jgi:uncharacterized membrane-anchored protein YitT (DUF2179 family)
MQDKTNPEELNEVLPPKITKENINPIAGTTKATVLSWVRSIIYILISSLLITVAVYSFIDPNDFTIGGVAGIAILVHDATDKALGKAIDLSTFSFCLNAPLVVLSFFFIKKKFALLSSLNILLQSFFLKLVETFWSDFRITFPGGETSKLLAAVAAGLCIGAAVVLALKAGGSTGGGDIIAVMIQKKFKATSIAWMLFIINCVVIVSYVLILNVIIGPIDRTPDGTIDYGTLLLPIVLSAFESYVESKTNESITNGFQSAIEFRIITDKPDEMSAVLMKELSRGVTAMPAKGMYTKENHTMILCVVNRRQVPTLRKIMKEVDPDSFAVMSKVSQVLGLGFYTQEMQ